MFDEVIAAAFLVIVWAWGVCFVLALPVFVVQDTRKNWAHGSTGIFGYLHTLSRVPALFLGAPFYVGLALGQALGFWRKSRSGRQ